MKVSDVKVDLVIRCLVDNKKCGSLIGRGGSVITNFRETSGAWVDIAAPVPGANNRIMTVKGNLQTVLTAFGMIAARLAESRQESLTRNSNASSETTEEIEIGIELLIGSAQAGAIIGKGGAVINRTREDSGARIKISSECLPNSTEKSVNIKGDLTAVNAAVQLIVTALDGVSDRPARQQYNPGTYAPEMRAYGAYQQYGGPVHATQSAYGGYGGYGNYAQTSQAAYPGSLASSAPHASQTLVLPVPENLIGGVIGRGGCHISEVRQRSGATIKIPKSDSSSTERMVTITGSPQQNELAISLIHQKMAAAAARPA